MGSSRVFFSPKMHEHGGHDRMTQILSISRVTLVRVRTLRMCRSSINPAGYRVGCSSSNSRALKWQLWKINFGFAFSHKSNSLGFLPLNLKHHPTSIQTLGLAPCCAQVNLRACEGANQPGSSEDFLRPVTGDVLSLRCLRNPTRN